MNPVRVGLVGAGPWAEILHAPMLAAGPETTLAVVYARRIEAARELAEQYSAPTPPTTLTTSSVGVTRSRSPYRRTCRPGWSRSRRRAGKALLLEKPLALNVIAAQQMAEAIDETGVPTQLMLTLRYTSRIRQFCSSAGFRLLRSAQHGSPERSCRAARSGNAVALCSTGRC